MQTSQSPCNTCTRYGSVICEMEQCVWRLTGTPQPHDGDTYHSPEYESYGIVRSDKRTQQKT